VPVGLVFFGQIGVTLKFYWVPQLDEYYFDFTNETGGSLHADDVQLEIYWESFRARLNK